MSTSRVIARNIFSNWANVVVSVLIGFFMMPFLIHRLGDTLYGVWTLVLSLVGYGNLLDLGVRSSIVKYVSQHHATDDRERLNSLFTTTLTAYAAVGALVLVIAGGLSAFLPQVFKIPAQMAGEARLVLLVVGLDLALKFPAGVFEGFMTGLQRYEVANAIAIVASLLRAGLTVLLVTAGGKLLVLATVVLATDLAMHVTVALWCLWLLPWLRLRRRLLSRTVLREAYTYGLWAALIALASRVLYDSDSIIIGSLLPAAAITHFAVANNLVRYLRQMAYGFGNVFNPAASALEARSEHERLERLVIHGTRYAFAVVLPAAVLLALLGREFFTVWLGPRFATESAVVLVVLALSQAAVMAQFPAGAVLYGLNRHRFLALVLLAEAGVKLVLSLALLPRFGIVGAAAGTALPEAAASLVGVPLLVARSLAMPIGRYLRESLLPPVVSMLPAAALVVAVKRLYPPHSWSLLLAEVLLGLAAYGLLALRCCLDARQRSGLKGLLLKGRRPAAEEAS